MLGYSLIQMLGSACWVIFYIVTQVLGHFNAGLFFFYPVSGETSQRSWERRLKSTGESAADLVHSF